MEYVVEGDPIFHCFFAFDFVILPHMRPFLRYPVHDVGKVGESEALELVGGFVIQEGIGTLAEDAEGLKR